MTCGALFLNGKQMISPWQATPSYFARTLPTRHPTATRWWGPVGKGLRSRAATGFSYAGMHCSTEAFHRSVLSVSPALPAHKVAIALPQLSNLLMP